MTDRDDRSPKPSVYDAVFSPLDEDTKNEYRIGKDARQEDARVRELVNQADRAVARAATAMHGQDKGDPSNIPAAPADAPKSPWQFRFRDWMFVIKTTALQFSEDRVSSVAGGVVFFGLLSLFPALTALVSAYGVLADRTTIVEHLDLLRQFLPQGAYEIIRDQIVSITSSPQTALSLAGVFAVMAALYSATGGMKALFEALNVAFFIRESRGFFKRNLVALAFTVGGIAVIIAMLFMIAVIPAALRALPLGSSTELMISILRWPLMFGVLIAGLAALYRWAPNHAVSRWDWFSPGALFAAVGLVTASILFSWYTANFANYNETYGSLGAAIGLMMWLWIAAMVVMIGAEINSAIEVRLRDINNQPDPDEALEIKKNKN